MNKILITGSDGFIGKNLVNKLIQKKKYKIFEIKNSKNDILNKKSLLKIPKVDYVIHLASKNLLTNKSNDTKFLLNNIEITKKIIEFCLKNNCKLIFLSSYIYGNTKIPTSEKNIKNPLNIYSLSKSLSEDICRYYVKTQKLECLILRLFNLYGKYQNKKFLIPKIIEQVENNKDIIINNTSPFRDLLYIDDFINLIEKIIKKNITSEIYNVGSGKSYGVKKIIKTIQNEYKTNLKVINKNIKKDFETKITKANIDKIKRKYNWKPKIDLSEGIKKIKNER